MYHAINRELNKTIGTRLQWVRLQENGTFVNCDETEGHGVLIDGAIYHVRGRQIIDRPTIHLFWRDSAVAQMAMANIAFVTLAEARQIDDITAAEHAEQFCEWGHPIAYTVGQIRRFRGQLFRCIQAHTSQEDWTPDATPALWVRIGDPGEEWSEWSQPIGAHDAYMRGDRVTHNERRWVSDIDNNVWSPGVHGWTEWTGE